MVASDQALERIAPPDPWCDLPHSYVDFMNSKMQKWFSPQFGHFLVGASNEAGVWHGVCIYLESFEINTGENLMNTQSKMFVSGRSWNLTGADLLFCTVPIVIFLSIVSFV